MFRKTLESLAVRFLQSNALFIADRFVFGTSVSTPVSIDLHENQSFAAFTIPKVRALVIRIIVAVFLGLAVRADVMYMNTSAAALGGPVVWLARYDRNVFIRSDGGPSTLVFGFVPSVSILEIAPELYFRLVDLLAVTIQECAPYRNASCLSFSHVSGIVSK